MSWEQLTDITESGRQELRGAGINISTALQLQSLGYTDAEDLQYLGDELNSLCLKLPPIQAAKLKKLASTMVGSGGGGTNTKPMSVSSSRIKPTQAPTPDPLPSDVKDLPERNLLGSGTWLVAACDDYSVQVWDLVEASHKHTLMGHKAAVVAIALTPDGKTIVSGSEDNTVRVWDRSSGSIKRTLKGHTSGVWSVALTPDGKTIVSGSGDNTVRMWDLSNGTLMRTLKGHTDPVTSVALTPDGKTIVSGSRDKTVRLWDLSSGTLKHTLEGHPDEVGAVALTPDGKTIISASGALNVCNKRNVEYECEDSEEGDYSHTVHDDDDSDDTDAMLHFWDLSSGTLKYTLEGHTGRITSIALTPDGKTIVSGSVDKTVRVWDLSNDTLKHTLEGHNAEVWSVALTPDGKTIVSGGTANEFDYDIDYHSDNVGVTVRVWDMSSGTLKHTLKISEGYQVNNIVVF